MNHLPVNSDIVNSEHKSDRVNSAVSLRKEPVNERLKKPCEIRADFLGRRCNEAPISEKKRVFQRKEEAIQ